MADRGDVMTVGELSRRAGVTVKALRRYEDMGMIRSPGRSAAGYRLFDQSSLRCVEVISCLRALGLTEAEIQRLFSRRAERSCRLVAPELAEYLRSVRARTETRIRELRELLARLDDFETRHRSALAGLAEVDPWRPDSWRPDPKHDSDPERVELDPTPGGRPYVRCRQHHTASQQE